MISPEDLQELYRIAQRSGETLNISITPDETLQSRAKKLVEKLDLCEETRGLLSRKTITVGEAFDAANAHYEEPIHSERSIRSACSHGRIIAQKSGPRLWSIDSISFVLWLHEVTDPRIQGR